MEQKKIQNSFIQSIRIFVYGPFARLLLLLLLMMMMMMMVKVFFIFSILAPTTSMTSIPLPPTNQPKKKQTQKNVGKRRM